MAISWISIQNFIKFHHPTLYSWLIVNILIYRYNISVYNQNCAILKNAHMIVISWQRSTSTILITTLVLNIVLWKNHYKRSKKLHLSSRESILGKSERIENYASTSTTVNGWSIVMLVKWYYCYFCSNTEKHQYSVVFDSTSTQWLVFSMIKENSGTIWYY